MATGTLSNTSLNTVTTAGMYRLQGGITDLPPWADGRWQWSQLFVMHGGGDTVTQIIGVFTTGGVDGYLAYRNNGDPGWDDWRQLATATKPAVYDLPLVYGWSVETPAAVPWYSKNQFGEVTVNIKAKSTENKNGCPLAKLPEGYRPKVGYEISVPCSFVLDDYSRGVGHIDFGSSGDINFYPDNTLNNPIRTLFCPTAVFQAA